MRRTRKRRRRTTACKRCGKRMEIAKIAWHWRRYHIDA